MELRHRVGAMISERRGRLSVRGILYYRRYGSALNPRICALRPMNSLPPRSRTAEMSARVALTPLEDTSTFADRAYAALKDVILGLDIYDRPGEVRLDGRRLPGDLGISRTPVREAMAQLQREGFGRSVPRPGIYVGRQTKAQVIEL